MSSDSQFTALGPAEIGFQTHGANIRDGANISGDNFGVVGTCGAGLGENGAGVQGSTEVHNGSGVVGIADNGTNAFGVWGLAHQGFAGQFDGRVRIKGSLRIEGSVTVTGGLSVLTPGAKSAVVPDENGTLRRLYAVESPESWFEEFGFGQLVDSQAQIELDSAFAYMVEDGPYHVFVSEYDGSNGLYVAERTSSSFVVRASESGVECDFSYRVAAKRKDVEGTRFEEVEEPVEESEKRRPGEPGPPQDPH
jgi:hypothetical protein